MTAPRPLEPTRGRYGLGRHVDLRTTMARFIRSAPPKHLGARYALNPAPLARQSSRFSEMGEDVSKPLPTQRGKWHEER